VKDARRRKVRGTSITVLGYTSGEPRPRVNIDLYGDELGEPLTVPQAKKLIEVLGLAILDAESGKYQ
jgi:hypothetical protein